MYSLWFYFLLSVIYAEDCAIVLDLTTDIPHKIVALSPPSQLYRLLSFFHR